MEYIPFAWSDEAPGNAPVKPKAPGNTITRVVRVKPTPFMDHAVSEATETFRVDLLAHIAETSTNPVKRRQAIRYALTVQPTSFRFLRQSERAMSFWPR